MNDRKKAFISFGFTEEEADEQIKQTEQLCKDLATFHNEPLQKWKDKVYGVPNKLTDLIIGLCYSQKKVKSNCGLWRILPYKYIPMRVKGKAIIKLTESSQEQEIT